MTSHRNLAFLLIAALALAGGISRAEEHEHEHEKGEHEKGEHGHHRGAKALDLSKLPPAATRTGVTFEKDIKPIFEDACTRCHGEDKQKGRIRLDSLEATLKGGEDGKILTPGNSAKSKVVISVARLDAESAMPPDRKPGKDIGADGKKLPPVKHLTAEEVGLIRAWIDQGAK